MRSPNIQPTSGDLEKSSASPSGPRNLVSKTPRASRPYSLLVNPSWQVMHGRMPVWRQFLKSNMRSDAQKTYEGKSPVVFDMTGGTSLFGPWETCPGPLCHFGGVYIRYLGMPWRPLMGCCKHPVFFLQQPIEELFKGRVGCRYTRSS